MNNGKITARVKPDKTWYSESIKTIQNYTFKTDQNLTKPYIQNRSKIYSYQNSYQKIKNPDNHFWLSGFCLLVVVVSQGFEPWQADPETTVLPLHHETILVSFLTYVGKNAMWNNELWCLQYLWCKITKIIQITKQFWKQNRLNFNFEIQPITLIVVSPRYKFLILYDFIWNFKTFLKIHFNIYI